MDAIRPCWVAGSPITGAEILPVHHPFDGTPVGAAAVPDPDAVERAVAAAQAATAETAALSAYRRADALRTTAAGLRRRAEETAALITAESGKPLRWSRIEVTRAAAVLDWAAEEARRWSGELQRLDTDPGGVGRIAMTRRVPRGPVLGIAPFNFPLNLVVHKLAPALAVGAPIIIKPAPATPLTASLLGELLAEADLPAGSWSVLPVPNDRMPDLVADPRLPVVSFTGSVPVGWRIRDAVPRKHVTLELGGNAAVVVCPDWSSETDLAFAARRIALFANYQAGQSCIAVQRVLVHRDLWDRFTELLVAAVRELTTGDPRNERTEVGPLIDETAARRVEEWIAEAVEAGGRLLTGGARDGATLTPAIVADVPPGERLVAEEVFGPVLTVAGFDEIEDAFAVIDDSRFGLQAGVFTHDLRTAFRASEVLDVGGVVVGDVPSYRADQVSYGGVKDSGIGREGVSAAMEDLTQDRVLILSGLG